MRLVTVALVGVLWSSPAAGATRSVPDDYPTIQAALGASGSGDTVRVSPGTYFETLTLGAAADGVTLISQSGPLLTILDGGRAGPVVTMTGVGSGTQVEGFTIRNGGGTFVLGAGVAVWGGSPSLVGNIITDNVGYAGAGIFVDGGAPTIRNNVICNNACPPGSGGGVYYDHSASGILQSNVIVGNVCGDNGGGVSVNMNSTPRIDSNTIVDNRAGRNGGGLSVDTDARPNITRNIIASNPLGGGLSVTENADPIYMPAISCNNVWSNMPDNYINMTDPTGTNANIALDPLFCDASQRDFHISATSPCAPSQSGTYCNLIGALGVDCSLPTPATPTTWGKVKADYRK